MLLIGGAQKYLERPKFCQKLLSTYNLYGRYAVPKIFDFWPNMLAPNSEVEVSHKTNLKSLAHLQPAQIGIFLIARLSDIWG